MVVSILMMIAGIIYFIAQLINMIDSYASLNAINSVSLTINFLIAVILFCVGFLGFLLSKILKKIPDSNKKPEPVVFHPAPVENKGPALWECWKCGSENPADCPTCMTCGAHKR